MATHRSTPVSSRPTGRCGFPRIGKTAHRFSNDWKARAASRVLAGAAVLLLGASIARGADVYWRNEWTDVYWDSGQGCGEFGTPASPWWYSGWDPNNARGRPDCWGNHVVHFSNTNRPTTTLNNSWYGVNQLLIEGSSPGRNFIGAYGINMSNASAKIENYVTGAVTVNVQVALYANTEINPVSGDLYFYSNIWNNGNWIDVWGNSGKVLGIYGVLDQSGGIAVKQHSIVVLTNNNTFSGGIWIEKGVVRLQGSTNAMGAGSINVGTNATLELNANVAWRPAGLTLYGMGTNDAAGALYSVNGSTWRGTITVSAASAKIRAVGSAFYTYGNIDIGANTLYITNSAIFDMLGGTISGTRTAGDGAVRKSGTGRLLLRPSGLSGSVFVDQGQLLVGTGNLPSGGTLTLSNGVTLAWDSAGRTVAKAVNIHGNVTLGRDATGSLTLINTVNLANGFRTLTVIRTNTISGAITNGGLEKAGATSGSLLILSGENTYTLGTLVSAGTLQIGAGGTSGSVAGNMTNNARVIFNRSNAYTHEGFIAGTGWIEKQGAGTLTLTNQNTYSGGTLVSAGRLRGDTKGIQGNITNNAAVEFNQSFDGTYSGILSGSGTLAKQGVGVVTLSGDNTYSGVTWVSNGVLRITHANALGSTAAGTEVASGFTLRLSGGITTAEPLTLRGYGYSGAGALDNASGNNTYAGAITLAANARIRAENNTLLTVSGTIANGGFSLEAAGGGTNHFSGAISGTGALNKIDAGTLLLTGANTYSGGTTISNGVAVINGTNTASAVTVVNGAYLYGAGQVASLTISGRVSAGTASNTVGQLTASSVTLPPAGVLQVELSSMTGTAGTDWDLISNSGAITVNASSGNKFTVWLKGNPTFDNSTGYTNTLITGSSVSGFSADAFNVNTTEFQPSLGGGSFSIQQSGNDLVLVFTPLSLTSVRYEGFEGSTSDVWSYVAYPGIAKIRPSKNAMGQTGDYSLMLTGSTNGSADPYVIFDNLDLTGWSGAVLLLGYACSGADAGDNLYLDISYDNGATWAYTTQLIAGASNFTNLFGNTSPPNTASANPVQISLTGSQVRVRVRLDESAGNDNSVDEFYIDDLEVKAAGGSPIIRFGTNEQFVGEDAGSVSIPVQISPAADATVQVFIAGTATAGSDYTIASTTVVFSASGPTSATVSLTITDDGAPEGPEPARFILVQAQGARVGGPNQSVVFIRDNDAFTILTANLSGGTNWWKSVHPVDVEAQRMLKLLNPDVIALQEWNCPSGQTYQAFVEQNFGTNYTYVLDSESQDLSIPNGIVSRWPITLTNEWADSYIGYRDHMYARIDIPGARDLHVVCVHFAAGDSAWSTRESEARELTNYLAGAGIPAGDYLVIAGDLNLSNQTEACLVVLTNQWVSNMKRPTDRSGDDDTNVRRTKPFDAVLPNSVLEAQMVGYAYNGVSFPNGMVFDTRDWSYHELPALGEDTKTTNIAHRPVLKVFAFGVTVDDPQSFTATATGPSTIQLSFTKNSSNDDVVIVYNTNGVFSAPVGVASNVGEPFAGGTVVYKGGTSPQNHTGLTACFTYYYKAWSYRDGTNYSYPGSETYATTFSPSAPTGLYASVTNARDFTAVWSASDGATGYRLDVSTNATFIWKDAATTSGTMIAFDFAGYAGDEAVGTSTLVAANMTISYITRGTNLTAAANAGRFNAQGWNGFTNADSALLGGDYFEWSVVPNAGYIITITNVSFKLQRSNMGASNVALRASHDGFTADLVASTNFTGNNVTVTITKDLGDVSGLRDSTGVTFRLAGWSGASSGSLGFEGVGDDIVIQGTVNPGGPSYVPGYSNRAVSGTSQSVTGLTPLVTYYYRVRAEADACVSENSATQSVTTLGQPSIRVLGTNDAEIVDGDTTPALADGTDFGNVAVNGGTKTHIFTITNSGTAPLYIDNVAIGGTHATNFVVTEYPNAWVVPTNLLTNGSFEAGVNSWSTSGSGGYEVRNEYYNTYPRDGTNFMTMWWQYGVYQDHRAGVGTTYTFAAWVCSPTNDGLYGDVHGEVKLEWFDAASNNLGSVVRTWATNGSWDVLVKPGVWKLITISNAVPPTGTYYARPVLVVWGSSGGGRAMYEQAQFFAGQPVGGSTTFKVRFDPSDTGTRTATLYITNNTTDKTVYDFVVQGTGTWPGIGRGPASISVSSTLGSTPANANCGVTNVGVGTLNYSMTTNAGWLSVSPVSGSLGTGQGQQHTVTFYMSPTLRPGVSNATITITDPNASNSPQTIAVQWTINAISNPSAASATSDGNELVRLAWTKYASYAVMITHRATNPPSAPAQGTVYNVGDSIGSDGTKVIYKGSGAYLDHVMGSGQTHFYGFYSINNNYYSDGLLRGTTNGAYRSTEIVEPFGYTNSVSLSVLNGGNGFTNAWSVSSGTWTVQSNAEARFTFVNMPNYPNMAGQRIKLANPGNGGSGAAVRSFEGITSGKVYAAVMMAYEWEGANKYAGLSFMNGNVETGFVGKGYGGNWYTLAIDTYGGSTVWASYDLRGLENSTNNTYLVIARYDFSTTQLAVKAYYRTDTVPLSEPATWDATATVPGGGISRIDGVRLSAGAGSGAAIGDCYFDELRIATTWAGLLNATTPYATNYSVNTSNYVSDALITGGNFNVTMYLRHPNGIESTNISGDYFRPNFDLWNPSGIQILTDEVFNSFTYEDSGKTLRASDASHAGYYPGDLGVYMARWSAISSNGVSTIDSTTLSNGTVMTFTVYDDDSDTPYLGSANLAYNPGFETNGAGWSSYGSGIGFAGASAESGSYGYYVQVGGGGGILRDHTAVSNAVYMLSIRARKDAAFNVVSAYLKIEFRGSGDVLLGANEVNLNPHLTTSWQTYSVIATSPANNVIYVRPVVGVNDTNSGSARAHFDNMTLQIAPMQVKIGVTNYSGRLPSVNATNLYYDVTDGDLAAVAAGNPLRLIFQAYDLGSGIARNSGGSANTDMNVDVGSWQTDNYANYVSGESATFLQTFEPGATSTWSFSSVSVDSLWSERTNLVSASVPDTDADRANDRLWVINGNAGYLVMRDDDASAPLVGTLGTNMAVNPGFETNAAGWGGWDDLGGAIRSVGLHGAEDGNYGVVFTNFQTASASTWQSAAYEQWINVSASTEYIISIRGRKDDSMTLGGGIYLKAEHYGASGYISMHETNIYAGALTNVWRTFSHVFTTPPGCLSNKLLILILNNNGGSGTGAAYFDSIVHAEANARPLKVYLGNTEIPPSENSSNAEYVVAASALTNLSVNPLRLVFAAYDPGSGLSRGTSDAAAQSHISIGAAFQTNVANYLSGESSSWEDSFRAGATSVWRWTSMTTNEVNTLRAEGTNAIVMTIRNADNDRTGDRESVENVVFGYLVVTGAYEVAGRVIYDWFPNTGRLYNQGGGNGWGTNLWQCLDDDNHVYDNGSFSTNKWSCPDTQGNKAKLVATENSSVRYATRTFDTNFTSGKVYFYWMQNFDHSGGNNSAYAGLYPMNDASELVFIGKTPNNTTLGFAWWAGDVMTNSAAEIYNGAGNDYLIVARYDFATRELSANVYPKTNSIAEEPEGYWDLTMILPEGTITNITGVRIKGGVHNDNLNNIGNVYFDEIRVGTNFYEVTRKDGEQYWRDFTNGPVPTLIFIGTNYTVGARNDLTITDGELANINDPLDFAVMWSNVFGVFMTNANGAFNIGSRNGRVNPNWDPVSKGTITNALGLDTNFTGFVGYNGANVVTTYVLNAFNLTNADVGDTFFITLSAENNNTNGGTFTAPNGADDVPFWRAITVNKDIEFFVTDDDTDLPVAGNLLVNPGFEEGTGNTATAWWTDQNAGRESWAYRSGTNGMAWWAWNAASDGGFGQDVYVSISNGDVVTFTIWGHAETGFVSSASEAFIKLEFWTGNALTYAITNDIYAQLVGNYEQWTQYRVVHTNTQDGITLIKPVIGSSNWVGYGHAAVRWDDATLTIFKHPLRVYVGSVDKTDTTPGVTVHTVTDGDLASLSATNDLRLVVEGYDRGSGLNRGTTDSDRQTVLHVSNLTTNNVANYYAAGSSPDTRTSGSTNAWQWTSPFATGTIQALMDAGSNEVYVTARDADTDRNGDQGVVSNRLTGYLRVVDDDVVRPVLSGFAVPGALAVTNLNAGDIAIVAYQADASDRFAVVTFVDIAPNTVISFTDLGWSNSPPAFRPTEGTLEWTAPAAGLPAGSIIYFTNLDVSGYGVSTGSVVKSGAFDLSVAGDTILAYQGSSTNPAFLYGISFTPGGWSADNVAATNSQLPSSLIEGVTAWTWTTLTPNDNGYYDGTTSGSAFELLTNIAVTSQWVISDSAQTWSSWSFAVTAPRVHVGLTDGQMADGFTITGLVQDTGSGLYRAGNYANSPTVTVYDADGNVVTGAYFATGPANNGDARVSTEPLSVTLQLPGALEGVYTARVVVTDYDVDRAADSLTSTQLVVIYARGDDDTAPPTAGAGIEPGNLLQNSRFEWVIIPETNSVSQAQNWTWERPDRHGSYWGTASRENWRSYPDGSYCGAIRGTWSWEGTEGGLWQEVTNAVGEGSVWRASAWVWSDANWTAATQQLKVEFYDAGSSNLLAAATNTFAVPGETWTYVSVVATAPANAVWTRWVMGASGVGNNGALSIDDVGLFVQTNVAMDIVIGSKSFYLRGESTNAEFSVTDGDLSRIGPTNMWKAIFNVYDAQSGIQRSYQQELLNYDIGTIPTLNDIYSTYSNTLSSSDTTVGTSTSVFAHVANFSVSGPETAETGEVYQMMTHAQPLKIQLSVPDADQDRANDELWMINHQFGWLYVSDDDTNGPNAWLRSVASSFNWADTNVYTNVTDEAMLNGFTLAFGLWDPSGLFLTNPLGASVTNIDAGSGNVNPNWDLMDPTGTGIFTDRVVLASSWHSPLGNSSINATAVVSGVTVSYNVNTIGVWKVQVSAQDADDDRGYNTLTNANNDVDTNVPWDRAITTNQALLFNVYDDDSSPPEFYEFTAQGSGGMETNIPPGGIAIIGVNGSPSSTLERFSFVVLRAFPAGTEILFTDCGWSNHDAVGWHRITEFHSNHWVAVGDADVGQVFELTLTNLNSGGDQIAVYQYRGNSQPDLDAEHCEFVYAINMEPAGETNGWDTPPVPDDNNHSALYYGLENGVSAVNIPNCPQVNCLYTGITEGSASELLVAIGNPNNWRVFINTQEDIELTNFSFTVTGQGSMEWTTPIIYDGEMVNGGWFVTTRVEDVLSGLLASNASFGAAPWFGLYNPTNTLVYSNAFVVDFTNGAMGVRTMDMVVGGLGYDNVVLGYYTGRVYVSDYDNDRVGDNRTAVTNLRIKVQDDDEWPPAWTTNANNAPLGVWIGTSNVVGSSSDTNAVFTITDADLASVGETNYLTNGDFEEGGQGFMIGSDAYISGLAAEGGTNGVVFGGWTGAAPAVWADVGAAPGDVFEFSVRVRKQPNWRSASVLDLKIEFKDSNSNDLGVTTSTNIATLVTTNWQTFSIQSGTAPAGTAYVRPVLIVWPSCDPLGTNDYDLYTDNWSLKRTNARPFRLVFAVYDADSGLSRGTTDPSTQMNVSVGALIVSNVENYVAAESTSDSRLPNTTNVWKWTSFNPADITAYVTAESNRVRASVFDTDDDRANDRLMLINQQFGILRVLDDDTNAPVVSGLRVVGTGGALAEYGTLLYFDFDSSDETPVFETNVERVANRLASGYFAALTNLTNYAGRFYQAAAAGGWTAEQYFHVTVTAEPNWQIVITNIFFYDLRSGTGPSNWFIYGSADGYTTPLAAGTNTTTDWRTNNMAVSYPAFSGTATFRIVGTNAGAAGGMWRIDSLTFEGYVEPQPGAGYVADADMVSGAWTLTGLVQDVASGVYAISNPAGPRYSIFNPNGVQLITNKPFSTGPSNNGDATSATPIADNIPAFSGSEVVEGTYTGYVYVTDFDRDRTDDSLSVTQMFTFTVIDDDTNAPISGTVLQGLTNLSPYAHLIGPMAVFYGPTNLVNAAGAGSNRTWYVTDMMMVNAATTNVELHFNLWDRSGFYRSDTEGGSNMTVSIENFVTNNYANYSPARSSSSVSNTPAATSVWVFTSFTSEQMASLMETTSRVTVTLTDADADRPNDSVSVTNMQTGFIAWRDNDPYSPLLQTHANFGSNALHVTLGASPGTIYSNLWVTNATPGESSNQAYRISDGQLATVSSDTQLMFRFHVYDNGRDNILGVLRGNSLTMTHNGRVLTNTYLSLGSVIQTNTANYVSNWSSTIGQTKIAAQFPTSYWSFTSFTYDQVGQFLPSGAQASNQIVLTAYDADNDRDYDQASSNLYLGWLEVYDDDTNAPVYAYRGVTNVLRNSNFETQGSDQHKAWGWEWNNPDEHGSTWGTASREQWRAVSGTNEATIRGTWSGAGTNGGWWQEYTNRWADGTIWEAGAWFWSDGGTNLWTSSSQRIKIEFYDGATNKLAENEYVFDSPGETWTWISVTATAPVNTAWARFVVAVEGVGDQGALQFDDAVLRPYVPLGIQVGNDYIGPVDGDTSTNAVYVLTDRDLAGISASRPLKITVGGYDAGDGLSRGTTDPPSQMNLTIENLTVSNVANYSAAESVSDAETRYNYAYSTWKWTSPFGGAQIQSLIDAGSNELYVTMYDGDNDRPNDGQMLPDQRLGFLRVIDNDSEPPIASNLLIKGGSPLTNDLTDQELRIGQWQIQINFHDISGLYTNADFIPSYSVINPLGVTVLQTFAFNDGIWTADGTNYTAWRNWAGAVDYDDVELGVYTVVWSAADNDFDRDQDQQAATNSPLIYSSSNRFTVVDDDTTAPTAPSNLVVEPVWWTNQNYFVVTFDPATDASGIREYRASTNATPPTSIADGFVLGGVIVTQTPAVVVSNAGFEVGYNGLQVPSWPAYANSWQFIGTPNYARGVWDSSQAQTGTNSMRHEVDAGGTDLRYTLVAQEIFFANSNAWPVHASLSGWFLGDMSHSQNGDYGGGFLKMEFLNANTQPIYAVNNEWDNGRPLWGKNVTTWSNVVLSTTNGPANTVAIRILCGINNFGTRLAFTGYWDNLSLTVRVVSVDASQGLVITNAPVGSNTIWIFSVDDDDDRPNDRLKSINTNVVTYYDPIPPPKITNLTSQLGEDETSEIFLQWDPLTDGERAGGGTNLSPWESYLIFYTDENRDPTTNDPYVAWWDGYTSLGTNITSSTTISNLLPDAAYRFAIAGMDRAGNIGPLSDPTTNMLSGFYMTQGVTRVNSYPELFWTAATNESGQVIRQYDLLYCDALNFTEALTNEWKLLGTGYTNSLADQGATNRTPPWQLINTMRFYRAAGHDRWLTNRDPRIGTAEIYGCKTFRLYPGQNWIALPFVPDCNTVYRVFGDALPAGSDAASSTRITWYEHSVDQIAETQVWLDGAGASNIWRYSLPTNQAGNVANTQSVPLSRGVVIWIPTNLAQPEVVVFVGRVPTNRQSIAVTGGGAYNLVGFNQPRWVHPKDMGLLDAGFKGGAHPNLSDKIWAFDRVDQKAKARIWYDSASEAWRYDITPNFPLVQSWERPFGPDDGLVVQTSPTNANWGWTNRILYSIPTRTFSP